jgi:hypothetical protein
MSNRASKLLTDTDTLRALAERIGESRLLDELEAAGLSRFTAKEMLRGTYHKEPRGCTRTAMIERLRQFGVSEAQLFARYTMSKATKAS